MKRLITSPTIEITLLIWNCRIVEYRNKGKIAHICPCYPESGQIDIPPSHQSRAMNILKKMHFSSFWL